MSFARAEVDGVMRNGLSVKRNWSGPARNRHFQGDRAGVTYHNGRNTVTVLHALGATPRGTSTSSPLLSSSYSVTVSYGTVRGGLRGASSLIGVTHTSSLGTLQTITRCPVHVCAGEVGLVTIPFGRRHRADRPFRPLPRAGTRGTRNIDSNRGRTGSRCWVPGRAWPASSSNRPLAVWAWQRRGRGVGSRPAPTEVAASRLLRWAGPAPPYFPIRGRPAGPLSGGDTMTSFIQFLLDAEVTDDGRGDFIEDARDLIEAGRFTDPRTRDELLTQVRRRRGCPEAERAAATLWAEYESASLLPRCYAGPRTTDSDSGRVTIAAGARRTPTTRTYPDADPWLATPKVRERRP